MEDRKINHPSSLAFLPTFIPVRTTIGRSSRPPLRTNVAALAARSKLIPLFSLFIRQPRFSSSLGFLRIPRPRIRSEFSSTGYPPRQHPPRFLRARLPPPSTDRPYTMLNCENINGVANSRSPAWNCRPTFDRGPTYSFYRYFCGIAIDRTNGRTNRRGGKTFGLVLVGDIKRKAEVRVRCDTAFVRRRRRSRGREARKYARARLANVSLAKRRWSIK